MGTFYFVNEASIGINPLTFLTSGNHDPDTGDLVRVHFIYEEVLLAASIVQETPEN